MKETKKRSASTKKAKSNEKKDKREKRKQDKLKLSKKNIIKNEKDKIVMRNMIQTKLDTIEYRVEDESGRLFDLNKKQVIENNAYFSEVIRFYRMKKHLVFENL